MPYLDRSGVRLHYAVHGEPAGRIPLFLTHGYSASTVMWEPNLPGLAADRQVVTWDIRGHGQSASPEDPHQYSEAASVADMAAVLDACGFQQAAVGGLSLGGYLSLGFWLAHPERVSALLLFDTGPGFKNDASREAWNERAVSRAVEFESEGLGSLANSPEVRRGDHDPRGLALAARGILTQRDARVIGALPAVSVPVLVLVGADDQPFLAAADYMAAKLPDATKVVLPDAGHASNIDQPEAFNRAVIDFLERTSDR